MLLFIILSFNRKCIFDMFYEQRETTKAVWSLYLWRNTQILHSNSKHKYAFLVSFKLLNICNWNQEIEEPGKDTSRFDSLVPTVVRPKLLGATNGLAHVEPPTDPVWVVPSAEEHVFQEPPRKGLTKLQLDKEVKIACWSKWHHRHVWRHCSRPIMKCLIKAPDSLCTILVLYML